MKGRLPMRRRPATQPTEAELEVLSVLWKRGPSTVREVHDVLQADRQTSLTTTLKILQVMTVKGLALRDESGYPHRYSAATPEQKTQARLVRELARKAFDGSVGQLLVRAVQEGDLSAGELTDIRRLIDQVRKDKGGRREGNS
jgi:BlaI family transcriptional regulator, penicillinase repressor